MGPDRTRAGGKRQDSHDYGTMGMAAASVSRLLHRFMGDRVRRRM